MGSSRFTVRQKQFSERSKTGCITCRRRHIQCDEERPKCHNCTSTSHACFFEAVRLPRRERTALRQPGEHSPWSIQQQHPSSAAAGTSAKEGITSSEAPSFPTQCITTLGPLYDFPIQMPLQSMRLLHYFSQTTLVPNSSPQEPSSNSITSALTSPTGLRNILLIAGFQYAWKYGHLGTFEQTFLFHKFQAVRFVNAELQPCHFITVCADHIITLCFSECTFGNFAVAETHLKGALLYMENRDLKPMDHQQVVSHDLCDRYFILAYNMVQGLKSRLGDYLVSAAEAHSSSRPDLDPRELERLVPEWHSYEADGVGLCFDAMGLFPSFFSSSSQCKKLYPVDAFPIINCVRSITHMFDIRNSPQHVDQEDKPLYQLWDQGGPSRLFSAVVNAHIASCYPKLGQDDSFGIDFESSWIGVSVVVGMYLTSVLGVWNNGQPEEDRLLRYIIHSSQRDLKKSFPKCISRSAGAQEFWFWKLFVTALHLAHAKLSGYNAWIDGSASVLTGLIRTWADVTETRSWRAARDKLSRVVWPVHFERDDLAEQVWDHALQYEENEDQ